MSVSQGVKNKRANWYEQRDEDDGDSGEETRC